VAPWEEVRDKLNQKSSTQPSTTKRESPGAARRFLGYQKRLLRRRTGAQETISYPTGLVAQATIGLSSATANANQNSLSI